MNRFLLLSVFTLLGLFPCKSQDVIVLHKENKLTGRVLWEKSKGDSLFYRSAVSSGDSLLLFVPRRRVEYVLSDGDRRMLYRGKTRGWQPWQGRTFNEVPQHRMLYGVSGGIITDGWSAEASAMRYLNRFNYFGIGGFVRYTETAPSKRKDAEMVYSYRNRAVSVGVQFEVCGYIRKLKTFYYLQAGVGCSYHDFSDWSVEGYDYENRFDDALLGTAFDLMNYPSSQWAASVHGKVGLYTRLSRGLYADLSFGCVWRSLDYRATEDKIVYKASDLYPFGVSLGLRFGRERR